MTGRGAIDGDASRAAVQSTADSGFADAEHISDASSYSYRDVPRTMREQCGIDWVN